MNFTHEHRLYTTKKCKYIEIHMLFSSKTLLISSKAYIIANIMQI